MKNNSTIHCAVMPALIAGFLIVTQYAVLAADGKKSDAGAVSGTDKDFILAAAQGGMLEVRLGEVAEKKGASQEVKAFGAMMVSDHGKAGEDLKSVAAKHGIEVPGDLDAKHKAIVDRLAKLSGSAFDKAYIDEMLKDHMKDASAFQGVAKNANDPDVKAFAQRTLPIIKAHLAKIKSIAGEHKSA
jgi:putative membrane protein